MVQTEVAVTQFEVSPPTSDLVTRLPIRDETQHNTELSFRLTDMASSNPEDSIIVSSFEEGGTIVMDTLKTFITGGSTKIAELEKKLAAAEEEKAYSAKSSEALRRNNLHKISQLENERKKIELLETRQAQIEKELRDTRGEVQHQK
jgi:hypothetical protein